ncbi:hypothetical protein [Peribacillus butanolivorans]|uniref:hypothetical protein n=1 Tax=Peribacillus butanolivorans TaxID=421767 RepID=UPI00366A6095
MNKYIKSLCTPIHPKGRNEGRNKKTLIGKDFATGVWDFVKKPGETIEGVANSIIHPIKIYKYIPSHLGLI